MVHEHLLLQELVHDGLMGRVFGIKDAPWPLVPEGHLFLPWLPAVRLHGGSIVGGRIARNGGHPLGYPLCYAAAGSGWRIRALGSSERDLMSSLR